MMNIKNFKIYTPKASKNNNGVQNALYLISEDGRDWYECQKLFSKDTIKFAYNCDGVIVSASYDVSALFPVNLSVSECERMTDVSVEKLSSGIFRYENSKICEDKEIENNGLISQAESKKQSLLAEATKAIAPLQDAVDLNMATDTEIGLLAAWKKYRVLLNRVDTSAAPDIDWPEKP
ncbi:tail fiber assembly protein [Providencia rettgeri]